MIPTKNNHQSPHLLEISDFNSLRSHFNYINTMIYHHWLFLLATFIFLPQILLFFSAMSSSYS